MARFKRTLVVEQNNVYAQQVASFLNTHTEQMEWCCDGATALEIYGRFRPDLLLVEAILPQIDGLALLERVQDDDLVRIVLTSINQDIIVKKAFALKADYIFVKPYQKDFFVSRVLEVADYHNSAVPGQPVHSVPEIRIRISSLLKELGVSPNVKGYLYLREALMIVYEDFHALNAIRDNIYRRVAAQYGTTVAQVERNIRTAIEASVQRADNDVFLRCFGYSISSEKGKPTNGQFLAAVADNLLLDKKKKGEKTHAE